MAGVDDVGCQELQLAEELGVTLRPALRRVAVLLREPSGTGLLKGRAGTTVAEGKRRAWVSTSEGWGRPCLTEAHMKAQRQS